MLRQKYSDRIDIESRKKPTCKEKKELRLKSSKNE